MRAGAIVCAGLAATGIAGLLVFLSACGKKADEGQGGEERGKKGPSAVPGEELAVVKPWDEVLRRLDDPKTDGWDSEVLSSEISERLKKLQEKIASGEIDAAGLAGGLTPDFSATPLVPEAPQAVFEKSGVRVTRGAALPEKTYYRGAGGFAEALGKFRANLGGESDTLRCYFKLVGIRQEGEQVITRQFVELAQTGEAGVAEAHAEWTITWTDPGPAGDPKMQTVVLDRFEQSAAPQRLFSDCTEAVLRNCESYRSQLLHGMPHWLQRIQDTRQMNLLGTPGTALGDVNGDGLDDLYLCQAGGLPNLLFVQDPDGTLRDATEESGTGWVESSRSALFVDLDNDGDQDLAVTIYSRLLLARNDGKGKFAVAAIVDTGSGAMSLNAADYDEDGDLDLYAGHYSVGELEVEAGATVIGSGGQFVYHDANNGGRNLFFRNDIKAGSDEWTFTEVTAEVGLDVNNRRFTLAAAWEDFDNDGDQDLYVANDFGRNNLYRNDEGRFTDIAAQANGEDQGSGMSVSWGDVNRDGRMDLYVGNMFSAAGNRIVPQENFSRGSSDEVRQALLRFARGNTLLVQQDAGFSDTSEELGVTMGRWAWSSMFADINNDGWEDLLVANGYITTPDPGDL